MNKNLLVFAKGTPNGGGSGVRMLIKAVMEEELKANIVGVVSEHENGGARIIADGSNTPFYLFQGPWTAERYQELVRMSGAEFVACSGWLKPVVGLSPAKTFNNHPGPLPRFGGKGMYGHHVHQAVLKAFRLGEIDRTQMCMHFVTERYDEGPVIFRADVEIDPHGTTDTVDTLQARVLETEHYWQWRVTQRVLNGEIHWDGKDPSTLVGYSEITLQPKDVD